MKYLFYTCLVLSSLLCHAQRGHYFLSHYTPSNEQIDHVAFDIAQDAHGIMYFATRAGILLFDGKSWELIPGTGAIYAIEINEQGDIFWAGAKGLGKVEEAPNGSKSIRALAGLKDVYQILAIKDHVYFLNDSAVFVLADKEKLQTIPAGKQSFTALFEFFGQPYISTDNGIFKPDKGTLRPATFRLGGNSEIIFSAHYESNYLFGTSDNRLFLSGEKMQLKEIVIKDREYIDASVIVSACWINRWLVALGTLRGGVVFLNVQTGKTDEIINYNTGLPDNEVLAMTTDQDRNLWVTHNYGFTCVAPFLPFRSFSHYKGLNGNLLCARSFHDEVYVGTSVGLFKLVKEEIYDDIIYYSDEPLKSAGVPIQTAAPNTEAENKKRGFFQFLRRSQKETITPKKEAEPPVAKTKSKREKNKVQRQTKKVLRSSEYVYRKVNGVEAKVTHLVESEGKLIAAGLAGIFEVNDLSSTPILEEPVHVVFVPSNDLLITSTYAEEVKIFKRSNGHWAEENLPEKINDRIFYIFEGQSHEYWLCGLDAAYTLAIHEGKASEVHKVKFTNPGFSETLGINFGNNVVLANTEGFFRFDGKADSLIRIDSLPQPKKYFASEGNLWYHDGHQWNVLGQSVAQGNVQLLNICNDIRFITSNNESTANHQWVITGNNELYKFFNEKTWVHTTQYPILLKSVSQADKLIPRQKEFKIVQEEGLLSFNVVQPAFTGTSATEYRYLLSGVNEEWSRWSPENSRINFSYLPTGNYKLRVEAKDIFGAITEMPSVEFRVQPPYWRRSWFYGLEFSFFALLVFLSMTVNSRYQLVNRLLSLITIILLIEFIQTVANHAFSSSSPVRDFAIQVVIAFLILPIEGFLSRLIFNKSEYAKKRRYHAIMRFVRYRKKRKVIPMPKSRIN